MMNAPASEVETTPEIDVKTLNVYQRINEVRKRCPFIKKNKEVSGGGNYMAVTHDKVTAELRDHLIDLGIVIVPRLVRSNVADTGTTTKNNIPIIRYEAHYEIDFVNIDRPDDRVTVPIEAHALDQGDKAPGKAASYATKYAMLKLFSIETGDAEEERIHDTKAAGKAALPGKASPTDGAIERLAPDRREAMNRVLSSIVDCFEAGQEQKAFEAYTEVTDQDERAGLWEMLKPHSKMRRRLKDMAEAARRAAGHVPAERDPNAHRRD
jgi:hypothetical protein